MSSDASDGGFDIPSFLDARSGDRLAYARLSPTTDTRERTIYTRTTAVIPVVFVPGIMGTNLRVRGGGAAAWRPPNGIIDGLASVAVWMWRGPKARQQRLRAAEVEVDPDGPIAVGGSGISEALARERGWGTVMKSSYHPILARMQERLNHIAQFNAGAPRLTPEPGAALLRWWNKEGLRSPGDYGGQQGLPPLKKSELVHAARYNYDVWCCGYNWLESSAESGRYLKEYIDNTVLDSYREKGVPAEKVIVVTHSMGGLVSRALTHLHGSESVLGVVHGVQPATGAPAFYHHARCGYEGVEQVILGRNAGEVTAVIANAPGALELAPTFDHDRGGPWLYFRDFKGNDIKPPLPSKGDPYSEIYATDAWYGLVPAVNTRYLNLSSPMGGAKAGARSAFLDAIDGMAAFHRSISAAYFDPTYSHYGADARKHSWKTISWEGNLDQVVRDGIYDDGNGAYVRYAPMTGGMGMPAKIPVVRLRPGPRSGGDGTVPDVSGAAPGASGAVASFPQGNLGSGVHNTEAGYEHQASYLDARAEWATLYSIAAISQAAGWHE